MRHSIAEGARSGLRALTAAPLKQVSLRARRAGQGLVEYALILVLVAIVVIGSLSLLGTRVSNVFEEVNCRLSGGTMHTDNGNGNSN